MKQLRLLRCLEGPVLRQLRKHEELTPLLNVPPLPRRPPSPLLVLAPEGLRQGPQPVGVEGYVVGEKGSVEEVPVHDDAIGKLPVPAEPAPPALPQLGASIPPVQDKIERPEDAVFVPETSKEILAPPLLLPPQRPQPERPFRPVRRLQRPGCL